MSDEPAADDADEPARPLLRVVRGDPTPEELAALVAVVAARSAGTQEAGPPRRRSAWADPALLVRPPHQPGPGGWRRAALPR